MILEIIKTVREAIENNQPIKRSDVLALVAVAEQVWSQLVGKQMAHATGEARRKYMCVYMRRYRERKRQEAQAAANTETQH
jgi:hypothetical protein